MTEPMLEIARREALPALAFAARVVAGKGAVNVVCGSGVEATGHELIAGAWSGPFAGGGFATATCSIGTGLCLGDGGLVAVVGTASATPIFVSRIGPQLVISNSLSLALARTGDRLIESHPFYAKDLATIILGGDRYRRSVRTEHGTLAVFYESMTFGDDLTCRPAPRPAAPMFATFADYRDRLRAVVAGTFANAADPARRLRYRPMATVSAGYDSPAAAVIARDAGCREGITFPQPYDRPDSDADSGVAIGRALGLTMTAVDTYAYLAREDLPDVEFIASHFSGGQVYLAAAQEQLKGRVVVSGYGGDTIWARDYGSRPPRFPLSIGGYSQIELFLRLPALDFAVPAIAARNAAAIGALSRGPDMQPWTIGGSYDRPIPRRLVEEAGVPRGTFARVKTRVTPDYDNFFRRPIQLDRVLTPAALAAFEQWFASRKPLKRGQALRHRIAHATLGRVLWSGRVRRALARLAIAWPPRPVRALRLKVPIRRHAFVFNWAVDRQVQRYRTALGSSE